MADKGTTNFVFILSKVSIITNRYTPPESKHNILSAVNSYSLIRNIWIKLIPLANPLLSNTKGTTSNDGNEANTRTLRLAVPGNTPARLFKTGEIVNFGRDANVETDYTVTKATRGTAFPFAPTPTHPSAKSPDRKNNNILGTKPKTIRNDPRRKKIPVRQI